MIKYILVDLPNTLFDSRHRTSPNNLIYQTGIKEDVLNYPCLKLLNILIATGLSPIISCYCLSRLKGQVEDLLLRNNLSKDYLITNYTTTEVFNNQTLKKRIFETIDNIEVVIDNDTSMSAYWLNQPISYINVPLGTY